MQPDSQREKATNQWYTKTKAIQIIYSGGGYDPDAFEVAPARRYLNAKGMTVVTIKSGSYTWLDRIWEWLNHKGFNK